MTQDDKIGVEALPPEISAAKRTSAAQFVPNDDDVSLKNALPRLTEAVEKELIIKALKKANGNKELAATLLEISRRSLFYKLKQYNIS